MAGKDAAERAYNIQKYGYNIPGAPDHKGQPTLLRVSGEVHTLKDNCIRALAKIGKKFYKSLNRHDRFLAVPVR